MPSQLPLIVELSRFPFGLYPAFVGGLFQSSLIQFIPLYFTETLGSELTQVSVSWDVCVLGSYVLEGSLAHLLPPPSWTAARHQPGFFPPWFMVFTDKAALFPQFIYDSLTQTSLIAKTASNLLSYITVMMGQHFPAEVRYLWIIDFKAFNESVFFQAFCFFILIWFSWHVNCFLSLADRVN